MRIALSLILFLVGHVQAMSFSMQERCYPELTPSCQTMVLAEGVIQTLQLPPRTSSTFTKPSVANAITRACALGPNLRSPH